MKLYTMGFTQKSAEQFFYIVNKCNIDMLIDIRLNNNSQLAGFTKGRDLDYFLGKICECKYYHAEDFAPTKQLLNDYKKGIVNWDEYVKCFNKLIDDRDMVNNFIKRFGKYDNVMLLCAEPTPEFCHRRLLSEAIAKLHSDIEVIHV